MNTSRIPKITKFKWQRWHRDGLQWAVLPKLYSPYSSKPPQTHNNCNNKPYLLDFQLLQKVSKIFRKLWLLLIFKLSESFPGSTMRKDPAGQCKRHKRCGFNPWVRKIPSIGNGNQFQYSCLENSMDRGAWWAMVYRVSKSQAWLKWFSTHAHVLLHRHNFPTFLTTRYCLWGLEPTHIEIIEEKKYCQLLKFKDSYLGKI